jgi:phosphoglycerate-specific signal transduction histidine kinase
MPMGNETANLFLQLGIGGAALFIILIFMILLFKLFTKINTNENDAQNNRIDKLCDKIDNLVTSYAENTQKLNEVLLTNDKDQKNTLKALNQVLELVIDIQRRVARIDDRTYSCLGNKKKEGE